MARPSLLTRRLLGIRIAFGSIGKRLDVYDVMATLSLGLVGYGLWLVWVPLTFIVVGCILFVIALAGARNRETKR